VALLFAALTPVFGQPKPVATTPPRPLPNAAEAPAVSPAPAQAPANSAPPSIPGTTPVPDKTVTLQYPNSDVVDVLHLYENLTGSKLIMDNFVQGKVNIFLSKPIPKDEAIKIIEMNLLMNGYSLVPAGDGIVKVIGTGRSPRNAARSGRAPVGMPPVSDQILAGETPKCQLDFTGCCPRPQVERLVASHSARQP